VPEENSLNHLTLRNKVSTAFHHDYSGLVSGYDEIDIAAFLLRERGINAKLTIHPSHPDSGYRPHKWNVGNF